LAPYASAIGIPTIPKFIEHEALCPALFNLWGNQKFNYKYYFELMPDGPIPPKTGKTRGLFEIANSLSPKPSKVALLAVANEWGQRSITEGAREICNEMGFEIVYEQIYPPDTTDFLPIIRAVQSANPDFIYAATYPTDSVGLIKALRELNYLTRLQFGGMVGLQYTSVQQSLGPKLNGIVNYHYFIPSPTMNFPGIAEFLQKYQDKAAGLGVDPLGYYLPPFAYARMQVLEQAIEATGTLDNIELGEYIKSHEFETIVNPRLRFAENGEWEKAQHIQVQFRNITSSDISEFTTSFDKASDKIVIVWPPEFKTGEVETA
jgi:branched-chain amino acid transport system substrate-binding protein